MEVQVQRLGHLGSRSQTSGVGEGQLYVRIHGHVSCRPPNQPRNTVPIASSTSNTASTKLELAPSKLAEAMTSAVVQGAPESDDDDDPLPGSGASCRTTQQSGSDRNEDLTLVENLELGPLEHQVPKGDPKFRTIEPYSKINLV